MKNNIVTVPSNIEWIGDIPADWKLMPLKAMVKEINEKNNPIKFENILSLTNTKGVIPYEEKGNQGNISKNDISQYKIAYKDTVIVNSMNLKIGSVGYSNYDGCVSPVYYVFKNTDISDLKFVNYIFQSPLQKYLAKYGKGIMEIREKISMYDVLRSYVPCPSIPVQKKIVSFLDKKCGEIDDTIEKNKKSIELLNEYKTSLISELTTHGLNKELKESNVNWNKKIPITWESINPKALFKQRKEKAHDGEKQLTSSQKSGILYQEDYMKEEGTKVVLVDKDFSILKHVEPNDFVISMRSFQGGLEYSTLSGSISSAYVMLIPNMDKVVPEFYKWFFKSSKYINALQCTSNFIRDGQAMRYNNFSQVRLFDIPIEEQKEIASYLNDRCKKIDSVIKYREKIIDALNEYKYSLIYEYITGKKEVN